MNTGDAIDRELAEQVDCPPRHERGCGQPVGHTCINLHTGEPLGSQAAHLVRLRAAGVTHDPLDPEVLAGPRQRRRAAHEDSRNADSIR